MGCPPFKRPRDAHIIGTTPIAIHSAVFRRVPPAAIVMPRAVIATLMNTTTPAGGSCGGIASHSRPDPERGQSGWRTIQGETAEDVVKDHWACPNGRIRGMSSGAFLAQLAMAESTAKQRIRGAR